MKFSGKMCLKIILKVTKNQGFALSLEDTFFVKPQWGVKLTSPTPTTPRRFRVKCTGSTRSASGDAIILVYMISTLLKYISKNLSNK